MTEETEYMHTPKPSTDLFSSATARFRELVSKPSAGVLDTDKKMAGGKVFLADTATAMVSNVKMVNNPVGTWKLSIFKCTSQHLGSHGLWFQRVLYVFAGFAVFTQ